jgi:AAA domain
VKDPILLFLTGPPGAGKSTVGRLVASRYARSTLVESDWFWTTIVSGFVPPWQPEADEQNQTMIRSAVASAVRMANGGYSTVVDGIVGPWHFDLIGDELCATAVPASYVVLRPDVETCLARAVGRAGEERVPGHPPLTDQAAIRHMWLQFSDVGEHERSVIDTTQQWPVETADRVCAGLSDPDRPLRLLLPGGN